MALCCDALLLVFYLNSVWKVNPQNVRLPPDFAAEAAPTIDAQRRSVGGASAPRAGWPYVVMRYCWCFI